MSNKVMILISAILSLGIFASGFSIGKGLTISRMMNRTITVKGLAERDVKSDLGIFEISYREVGNNLTDLNQNLQHDQAVVTAFLKQHGFMDTELEAQPVKVEDRLANVYSQQNNAAATAQRFILTSGMRVRSSKVNLIQQVNQLTGTLLQQNIPLAFETNVNPNPSYYFTALDTIRPQMLADATKSARLVAEQFAKDSDSQLKGIQHASQGLFQIMGRDTSTLSADWNSNQSALGSIDKKIRLVTTIDYRLK